LPRPTARSTRSNSIASERSRRQHADLVAQGRSSQRIADVENVELVFKDGLAYDPKKLIDSVRGMVGIR
jgi:hypothetical protein